MPGFGRPSPIRISSNESVLIYNPTRGIDVSQPSVDAPLGSTPGSDNYVFRDGAIEPRAMLSLRNSTPQPFGNDPILGGRELVGVDATRYAIASGTTRVAGYGLAATPNAWSVLSYVSSNGLNDPPNLTSTDFWDWAQQYWALRDENLAIGATSSYQSLYCTQSNTTVFSSLTGAPQARFVATMDNYVVCANLKQGTLDLVQRVQWSDRGDPSAWTTGTSGFQDLMDMQGQITRLLAQENRLVLFSENEIWQGIRLNDDVFVFSFAPYDRSVGCPYSYTAADTPAGTVFLSKDLQLYLLPKGGGSSRPIGQRLHREIRNTIDHPERAWAAYDHTAGTYNLYFAIKGGSGKPQRAVYLDVETGAWAPQSFDRPGGGISLTRGFEINVSSSATTWGALSVPWSALNKTWAELGGSSEERSLCVGSSTGTLYTFNSNATNDNGTAVQSYWRSIGLGGSNARQQKTLTQVCLDYQGDSASSVTVRISTDGGGTFGNSISLNLPATSQLSQAIGDVYAAGRYPSFEISSEGFRPRIYRMYVPYRPGGR